MNDEKHNSQPDKDLMTAHQTDDELNHFETSIILTVNFVSSPFGNTNPAESQTDVTTKL